MSRTPKPFGKRHNSVAEFRSYASTYSKGQLQSRRVTRITLRIGPIVASALVVALAISPEVRAFAGELGSTAYEIGKDWLLRGTR